MTTAAERSRLADRIWLQSYPEGVPAEIDPERYRSLVEVFRESVQKYCGRAAYVSIGTQMTYGECETLATRFAAWLQACGVRKGDRVAIMLPNSLQYPVCLFGTLLAGAIVVNVNPLYTASELAHQLRDSGAQTIVVLEDPGFARRDFSAMKITIGGGMAVQRAIAQRWKQVTGHTIVEGYGLTECSPVVTMNPPDIAEFTGSIGLPMPSTEVRFMRDDGSSAPVGEPGELQVRGPQVMRGYWQRAEETARAMSTDGWFSTGDIGVMDARGYIRLIDRKKDMILVSGFNVYPNEIEDVIALHPDVLEVAAIGVPDPVAGERVKVIVVPRGDALTEAALLAHCRAHLSGYKVPRFVEFRREGLPKSAVGKILRRALRDSDPDIQRARAARA
ncbi:AMP-binding protein [Ralstonia pseudosolanacearum]|uniref:AMP-binding protein n=1 Tax=Ralstonia pseudosolanacearum TaxID=1310165 RepID=UPI00048FAD49|nr:AMP-binding protein [Ralstonia pseudosolanacearum]